MGRRSKNKQGDPEPFADRQDSGPAKKLGKRKPEHEDGGRPVKKAKESAVPLKGKPVAKKTLSASRVAAPPKAKEGKGKSAVVEDDGDLGWEDMEDDIDLKAASKYVGRVSLLRITIHNCLGPFSRTMKTKTSSKASRAHWTI